MKEASNFIRATGQMTQSAYCFGFHVRESENASSPQPMRFDFSPNAFARVQFRTIPRQSIDAQLSLIATHLFGYFSRLMRRMAIPNQKDGLRSSRHQAIQKSANDFPIHFIFFNHKSHPASPIYHAQHVQPIPRTRTPHHRRLPLRPPGGSRMIIASQPRFIRKPYLRPHPLGFFHNRRIFLLDPLPHPFRILLVRSPQRFLGGNSQLGQQNAPPSWRSGEYHTADESRLRWSCGSTRQRETYTAAGPSQPPPDRPRQSCAPSTSGGGLLVCGPPEHASHQPDTSPASYRCKPG